MFFKKKEKFVYKSSDTTKSSIDRDVFLKSFKSYVEKHKDVVLFLHINPDGDCIGGTQGMKEILKQEYPEKNIYVVGSNFGLFPWLKTEFDSLPSNFDYSKALALIIDVGTSDRIQEFDTHFKKPDRKWGAVLIIDHHNNINDFSYDLKWDDGLYAATCCQIVQLCDYFSWKISPKASTFLMLGIITDTASFQYSSTLPRTLILAAKVMRSGADTILISSNLTKRSFKSIETQSFLIKNVNKEKHVLWYYLKKDDIKKLNLKFGKSYSSTFANIEDYLIWMFFSDQEDGKIRFEIRSISGISIRNIAIKYGGGGHDCAAGAILEDSSKIQDIVKDANDLAEKKSNMFVVKKSTNHNVELDSFKETIVIDKKEILKSKEVTEKAKKVLKEVNNTHSKKNKN